MKRKILITSALPYANGPLHFGHLAGAYLPADCYARFERLRGSDVLYICGSDEYGVAIALNAELAGRTPKEHSDIYHEVNKNFFKQLAISFDHYSRTTCEGHQEIVSQFFLDLLKNGYVEERETEELYSEADHKFLADRYVIGTCPKCGFEEARGDECGKCGASYEAKDLKKPRSKLTSSALILKKTRHYFLLFDRFKEQLEAFLSKKLWKSNVVHFAKRYIDEIHPRAITRDLKWGVPVPLKEAAEKVFYVWFDAPIGYISATQDWAQRVKKQKDAWKQYWLDPHTKYVQFMGKDNIPFHAVFFPAMIMGQDTPYKLVDDLVANEFFNLEGKKFSKSDGNIIDLDDFFKRFHVDQIRYAIAANSPETGDSEFTWKDFQLRCNAELLGKWGNLVHRVLVFADNHTQGKVPPLGALEQIDHRFINEMHRICLEIEDAYSTYKLRRASHLMMELAQAANAYFDAKAPWKDTKAIESLPLMQTTIALCLECLKRLAIISHPILPQTTQKVFELLGFKESLEKMTWKNALEEPLREGTSLGKSYILFQKIEDATIEEEVAKLKTMHEKATLKQEVAAPLKPTITYEDFEKIDLRVGLILKAEKVEKSKKLLRLEVDIGLEKRTIVSGISMHYSPEQLVGKKVIVVANLQSAKLMGILSEGMILAGSIDSKLELVTLTEIPAGTAVH